MLVYQACHFWEIIARWGGQGDCGNRVDEDSNGCVRYQLQIVAVMKRLVYANYKRSEHTSCWRMLHQVFRLQRRGWWAGVVRKHHQLRSQGPSPQGTPETQHLLAWRETTIDREWQRTKKKCEPFPAIFLLDGESRYMASDLTPHFLLWDFSCHRCSQAVFASRQFVFVRG